MDLEGLLGFIWLVLHWRVAVCMAASTVTAILAVQSFSWLTGLQGIVISFLGLGFGAMWQVRSEPHRTQTDEAPDSQTSTAVAGTAAALAGAFWGVFSSSSFHSFLAGIAIFLMAAWWWSWYAQSRQRWVSSQRAWLCIGIAACTYVLGALVGLPVL
jgi:hypothetical protein